MYDFIHYLSKRFDIRGRDVMIFMTSLLLAFGIWMMHNMSSYYTSVVQVRVSAVCNIEGHSNVSSNTAVVVARCHTSGMELMRIAGYGDKNPLEVDFSVSDLRQRDGETFYLTGADLQKYSQAFFGDDAKVEAFISDTVEFRFPFENCKKVPVQPIYSSSFEPQYMAVGGLKMVPDSVMVYGEPLHLENIDKVYTKPFSLDRLNTLVHGSVKLEEIKKIRFSETQVEYSMNVSRYVELKASLPVVSVNVPADKVLIAYPSVLEVTLLCSFPVTFNPEEKIRACVDYNDYYASISGKCIPVLEGLPAGVLGYTVEPHVVDCVEGAR